MRAFLARLNCPSAKNACRDSESSCRRKRWMSFRHSARHSDEESQEICDCTTNYTGYINLQHMYIKRN